MNTPYFSREDQQPITTFVSGNCGFDRVYINGLEPGDLLISHSPYVVYKDNGLLTGLDERFTRFEVVHNGKTLTVLTLIWQTDCSVEPQLLTPLTNGISELPIPILLMIVSLVYLAVLRRIRR